MARIVLPNECSCTSFLIIPKNWDKPDASLKCRWQIRYRFYDPLHQSVYPNGKQIRITGIHGFDTLAARRKAVRDLMANELDKLRKFCFNPITESYTLPEVSEYEIPPSTPFPIALKKAKDRLVCVPKMKTIIGYCLEHIIKAIRILHYENLTISEIKRRHVRLVLDQVGRDKNGWTASNFNHYRSYMKMLFDVLEEMEATELDPVSKIKKMKEIRKIRAVMSTDERTKVIKYLSKNHYTFYRFIEMFFHSGARLSEMVRIRKSDVDLENQRVKVTVRKGDQGQEVYKTIKDIALPFWREIMQEPGEVLFSKNLRPGQVEINAWQITKRWRVHVKENEDLLIKADLYSLKHSHTTEVVEMLSTRDAAEHNSHANDSMVAKVYDIRRSDRQHDRVKKLNNPL